MSFRFKDINDADEIIRILMDSGLSRQQAQTSTASHIVDVFTKDSEVGIDVLRAQVNSLKNEVYRCKEEIYRLNNASDKADAIIQSIEESTKLSDEIADEKAKNALMLYSAIIQIGINNGADINKNIENAGYILYAYLGGQAKREQRFIETDSRDHELRKI